MDLINCLYLIPLNNCIVKKVAENYLKLVSVKVFPISGLFSVQTAYTYMRTHS